MRRKCILGVPWASGAGLVLVACLAFFWAPCQAEGSISHSEFPLGGDPLGVLAHENVARAHGRLRGETAFARGGEGDTSLAGAERRSSHGQFKGKGIGGALSTVPEGDLFGLCKATVKPGLQSGTVDATKMRSACADKLAESSWYSGGAAAMCEEIVKAFWTYRAEEAFTQSDWFCQDLEKWVNFVKNPTTTPAPPTTTTTTTTASEDEKKEEGGGEKEKKEGEEEHKEGTETENEGSKEVEKEGEESESHAEGKSDEASASSSPSESSDTAHKGEGGHGGEGTGGAGE
uniref:Uncharacterized protein n=1 Tax=Chromera velia CCMP2878 TaxID=1169474 RepID=A0A0G4HW13_9ALVE|eukprot:Cvel_32468.t1-p1 / transcript=Cvel_32468.t1 / gene=Cvel_32468 / organism=Chromera_velia_CCMP2878 / gene_product=hypothetical protein / transcript_product=hypothetical protein / location=Cvel_scaffold5059:5123-5986(+) / protein_length=288 / sequence_SO=supercontig / SO=protein_coding / is_pseudo=false